MSKLYNLHLYCAEVRARSPPRFAPFGNIHILMALGICLKQYQKCGKRNIFRSYLSLSVVVASTGRIFLSVYACTLLPCLLSYIRMIAERTNGNDVYVTRGVCSCVRWRVNYHDLFEGPLSLSVLCIYLFLRLFPLFFIFFFFFAFSL